LLSKKEIHVGLSTVAYDHCIGCGICDVVCPHDAIDMVFNKFQEIQPNINENCTECTICVKYCPFTNDKIIDEAKKVSSQQNPNNFGVDTNDNLYISYDKRIEKRQKSASGGVVSAMAIDMLEKEIISSVLHAEMSTGKIGESHYKASISRTIEEIESKRSSFYAPISFHEVLKEFYHKEENILIMGVPCVIRAVTSVFEKNRHYKKNKIFTIALSCSHNVNGQFTDFLAESEGISKEESFKVNLRAKGEQKDANHFKNHFFKNDSYNGNQTILKKDRFQTIFTETWRNYFFSMNVCNKCSDFWGYTADVSIKDAWGKWADDPLGKSIVIIRNDEVNKLFNENNNLKTEKESYSVIVNSQEPTTRYKQVQINNRINKSKYHISNLLNGYTFKDLISEYSKKWYLEYGYKKTYKRLKYIIILAKIFEILGKIMNKIEKKKTNPYIKFVNFYLLKIKNLFSYKKIQKSNQIMVTGGYGYKNVGDEAQLNATMQLLKKELPNYRQVILTHDRNYTYKEHGPCIVFESPREAFFDHNDTALYGAGNLPVKALFLFSGFLTYFNAYLVRAGLPTLLINAKKAALLEELKNSDMLFYSGGGYLTGKTLSRLWDGVFFIACAKVMHVPVVLSGHTIGIWNSGFNKWFAKWGLSKANIITTRDPEASIEALNEIGLENENTFVTFDDALFCDKINTEVTKEELLNSGLKEKDFENYITLNIHYWGLDKDNEAKKKLRKRINNIVEFIVNKEQKKIVLIAMTPSDYNTINDFMVEYPNDCVISYKYQFDFRKVKGVIANSKICITMKHHPIIFAVGEKVPVISLANFDYYEHKNGGALKLFRLEKYNLIFNDNFDVNNFIDTYHEIFNYTEYKNNLNTRLDELKLIKRNFLDKTKELLGL
jgi:coenzyme F420 hydrogenase subunit beta